MSTKLNRLTARFVATVKEPGLYSDGGNLYLSVTTALAKSWLFIYRVEGRQPQMGLGSAFYVGLAEAREEAAKCRAMLRQGVDPLAARRVAKPKVLTFGECADQFVEAMRPSWKNAKHAWQVDTTLKTFAASLRDIAVDKVETADVLEVLKPIWSTKSETASRLRGRIEAVLDGAKAKGLRTGDNPARWRGHLDHLLPPRKRLTRGHQAAMAYADVPKFMTELRAADSVSARALEFTVLTGTRTGEVIGATWDEIELSAGLWTIPAARMKTEKEHRVPLVGRTVEILRDLAATRASAFVFPGPRRDKAISNMAMMMTLRRMNLDVTVHGFRSAFRDWASEETDFPHEIQEMALAHVVKSSVERAYRRGDLLEKRRDLMTAWNSFCLSGAK